MAAPEFELEPPEPILYLCDWCLDAGPLHLEQPCGRESCKINGRYCPRCECPCNHISDTITAQDRLKRYCSALRTHARIARGEARRDRRAARSDMRTSNYYSKLYNALVQRQQDWTHSEKTIADLKQLNVSAIDTIDKLRQRLRETEKQVYAQIRLTREFQKKAAEYDKLFTPTEPTTRRHIVLDDES